MSRSPAVAPSRTRRQRIVSLLACLVVCQSILASVLSTLGPSHRHDTSPRFIVLEDVRRAAAGSAVRPSHVSTALGHFHGAADSQRHYHPRTDVSVVLTEPAAATGDDPDGAASAASAFVAMLPAAHVWTAAASPAACARATAWPSITDDPEPLERPPRRT